MVKVAHHVPYFDDEHHTFMEYSIQFTWEQYFLINYNVHSRNCESTSINLKPHVANLLVQMKETIHKKKKTLHQQNITSMHHGLNSLQFTLHSILYVLEQSQ